MINGNADYSGLSRQLTAQVCWLGAVLRSSNKPDMGVFRGPLRMVPFGIEKYILVLNVEKIC